MESENLMNDIFKKVYPHKRVKGFTVRSLDSGGLHFSCDVTELKVQLEDTHGDSGDVYLIMKKMPAWEKRVLQNSQLGFRKEAGFYEILLPAYKGLLQNHGLSSQNLFPNLVYASDHEILLEDLRLSNYLGAKERLDERHTLLVLSGLAEFHATGIALKMSDGEFFSANILPVAAPALRLANNENRDEINRKFRSEIISLISSMEDCQPHVEKVNELLQKIDYQPLPPPREPLATVLHNDLWRGNVLFKYSPTNEPEEVKFIDFQTTIYNSPARDLAYLLCTSVQEGVFKKFDSLMKFYHKRFLDCLTKLGCGTESFTFEGLQLEMDTYGPTKLKHIILLHKAMSGSNDTAFEQSVKRIILMFKERNWL